MQLRNVKCSDYNVISPLINEWWGGRQMSDMLPKVFFVHFNKTSFIAEKDGETGFLIGFLSQSNSDVAYIHFVGVNPAYRKNQIGKQLYYEFFNVVKKNNRNIVLLLLHQLIRYRLPIIQKWDLILKRVIEKLMEFLYFLIMMD